MEMWYLCSYVNVLFFINMVRSAPMPAGNKTVEHRILNFRHPPTRGNHEQDIVFPDDIEFVPLPKIDGVPKCADNMPFCETFDRYPYHHLQEVLNTNNVYKDLFGVDEVPQFANRIGDDGVMEEEEMFVCKSVTKTIYPKLGKNKDSQWKYIINQGKDERFIQGVRVEMCQRNGGECDLIGDLSDAFITSCKQKYVYRRLLSISDDGKPIPDTFLMPSACCCAYKRNLSFLNLFSSRKTV